MLNLLLFVSTIITLTHLLSFKQEKINNMRQLNDLEEQMLVCLASDTRLLNDLATTRKLADLKKHYDETLERYD